MLGRTPFRLLAAALAIAAGGCTSDSPPTSSGDAIAPTTLGLLGLSDTCTDASNGCIDATAQKTLGAAHPFVLAIKVQGLNRALVLRPPGYCGVSGVVYCGHLVATATRNGAVVATARSATASIELPLDALEDLDIRIELHNDKDVVSSAAPLDVVWSNNRLCLPGCSGGASSGSGGGMGGGGGASSSASSSGMGGGASDAGADGG